MARISFLGSLVFFNLIRLRRLQSQQGQDQRELPAETGRLDNLGEKKQRTS